MIEAHTGGDTVCSRLTPEFVDGVKAKSMFETFLIGVGSTQVKRVYHTVDCIVG